MFAQAAWIGDGVPERDQSHRIWIMEEKGGKRGGLMPSKKGCRDVGDFTDRNGGRGF